MSDKPSCTCGHTYYAHTRLQMGECDHRGCPCERYISWKDMDPRDQALKLANTYVNMHYKEGGDDPVQQPIRVWRFHDAPELLQALSECGGDEDWLLLAHPRSTHSCIPWAEDGQRFGACDVDIYTLENGWEVRIGSHA